jgi:hypothetical protein
VSRSLRHSPFIGITCCYSEKSDKRIANRKLRRRVIEAIRGDREPPVIREVSNVWLFGKDGKQRVSDPKWLRK